MLPINKTMILQRIPFRLILILGIFMLGVISPAEAQEKLLRTLTVTGEGVENIATSLAEGSLGIEISGRSANDVQKEIAKQTTALIQLLQSRKVQKLQTTGIQLQPNYDYINNQRNFRGYTGTNSISFRFSTEGIGELLDEAVKSGVTRINGVSFLATDQAIAEAQAKALKKATIEAQSQAQSGLQALNLTARDIVSIQVNGATPPVMPKMQADFAIRAAAAPPTPVIGGERAVRASVTLQISY